MKLNFIYIGASKGIIERAKVFAQKIKISEDVSFISMQVFDSDLLYSLSEEKNLILLDFPIDHEDFHAGVDFLEAIRRSTNSKSFYFCLACEDDKHALQYLHYFRAGINSIYNKDGDFELFLFQLFYIANNDLYIPRYATTKKFYAKSQIRIPLFIETFSEESTTIASDFKLPQEIFIDNFIESYKITGSKESEQEYSQNSFTRYTSLFQLNFPNAWDNDLINSFDTISTQIQIKLEGMQNKKNILLITENLKFISFCKKHKELFHRNKITSLHMSESNLQNKKIFGEYDLIVLDEMNDIDEGQRFDVLLEIVNYNKSNTPDALPYVLILNSSSTTEALTKVLKYKNLLAAGNSFTEDMLAKLIQTFGKKEKIEIPNHFNISCESPITLAFLNLDVVITALNEFRITFITEVDIPLYSFVQIDMGVILNILIVPPTMYMAKVGDKTHYMGFFFGMSEKTLQKLRILVNHFLNIRVDEINDTFFDFITDDMKKIEPAKVVEGPKKEEVPVQSDSGENKTQKSIEPDSNFKKGYYSKM